MPVSQPVFSKHLQNARVIQSPSDKAVNKKTPLLYLFIRGGKRCTGTLGKEDKL